MAGVVHQMEGSGYICGQDVASLEYVDAFRGGTVLGKRDVIQGAHDTDHAFAQQSDLHQAGLRIRKQGALCRYAELLQFREFPVQECKIGCHVPSPYSMSRVQPSHQNGWRLPSASFPTENRCCHPICFVPKKQNGRPGSGKPEARCSPDRGHRDSVWIPMTGASCPPDTLSWYSAGACNSRKGHRHPGGWRRGDPGAAYFCCRKILLFFCFRTIKPNIGGYAVSIRGGWSGQGRLSAFFFSRTVARETIMAHLRSLLSWPGKAASQQARLEEAAGLCLVQGCLYGSLSACPYRRNAASSISLFFR